MTRPMPLLLLAPGSRRVPRGFTLIELMVTLVVLSIVMIALVTVMYTASRNKTSTINVSESAAAARSATDLIARDLRSAGYGADMDYVAAPQRPIAYIDSMSVLINTNQGPYPDTAAVHGWPLAYNPGLAPNPYPLTGTSQWKPPIQYTTGAEIVCWTLDLDNNGSVNAADLATTDGQDAARTPNPNDFELVRRVYGETSSSTNGGQTERVALVNKPGSGVAPMFTVYFKGNPTPYDWSSGPVAAGALANIDRIVVTVTAPSGKPDAHGQYASTKFTTEVNSMRNVPDFGEPLYGVNGRVFNDVDEDGTFNTGDTGIPSAQVTLGIYSASTNSSGDFSFQVPKGTYTLRHTPPPSFGVLTAPDSFVVTVPPGSSHSFADTAKAGGWVYASVFNDLDADGVLDAGEGPLAYVKLTLNGSVNVYTDPSGYAPMFAPVGGWSVNATPPDSFAVSTPNPVSGTMADGGTQSIQFGMYKTAFGTVNGKVFNDVNRDGIYQGGESGIKNVWVGVSPDGGITLKGSTYTDNQGLFSIQVPMNDPPKTSAYYVMVVPPIGFYPTNSSSLGPVWIKANQSLTGYNFGMSSFTIITLDAQRVLSLGTANLAEKDAKSASLLHNDPDLVLGADASGTDQISVWFNQWNASPVFKGTPSYARSAPNSVLSMGLAPMDKDTLPDLVTGTKATAAGNFFVWLDQNTSGNEGFYPTTYTTGLNYKTQDNGDVQALITLDCAGLTADRPDIIVGTKAPTAGQGSIEIWRNTNSMTGAGFVRDEIYPPAGGMTSGSMGEVTSIVPVDFDGDGYKDLAVGTTTGSYRGEVLLFKFLNRATLPHYVLMATINFDTEAVTSVAAADVDGDGYRDLFVGTQASTSSGGIFYYLNKTPSLFDFQLVRRVDAPGIVLCMATADLGGSPYGDLAVGYRQSTSSYAGGVRIYYLDGKLLPSSGSDPGGGGVLYMVPAMVAGDFNYGLNPMPLPPYLTDLAVGMKSGATTGALIIFIR